MSTPRTEALADIRAAQARAWANKIAKGFSTTDVALEFGADETSTLPLEVLLDA